MGAPSLPYMMPTPVPVNSSSSTILPSGKPTPVAHLAGGPVAHGLMRHLVVAEPEAGSQFPPGPARGRCQAAVQWSKQPTLLGREKKEEA